MNDLLVDLAIVMVVAAVMTIICNRLRQPVVLGYLLAGLLISPNTSFFPVSVSDQSSVQTLAQFGVVMLMFGLGLTFSFNRQLKILSTAMAAVTLEIVLMVWLGYQAGQLFGWSKPQSILLGAMLLSSSTIIITNTLNDLKLARERFAQMVWGMLSLDDICALVVLVLIASLATTEAVSTSATLDIARNIGIFLTVTFVVGLLLVPHLLRYVANLKNDEILLLTVLGLGFGISLLGVKLGYSAALGAFVIGAIIAETRMQGRINELVSPIRYMFNAIFFVAVGMLIDPDAFMQHWPQIIAIAALVIFGKTFSGALGAVMAGQELKTSLRIGMGMAQIGEFAFIIALLGVANKLLDPSIYTIIICAAAITIIFTPYLIKYSLPLAHLIEKPVPRPIREMLTIYHRWFHRQPRSPMYAPVKKLVRKTILQIILNMVLIAAIFIIAAFGTDYTAHLWPQSDAWTIARASTFWLVAMLCSLPLLAATFRKLRAMAMLLAEVSIVSSAARQRTQIMRLMLTNTILVMGIIGMGVYILILSSAIMPPWPVMAILLIALSIYAYYRWQGFIQLYATAQAEIGDTLFTPEVMPDAAKPEPPKPLPPLLYAAELEMVRVAPGSPLAGKFIRETQLRVRTGASVVGIERKGENIVNPGPDEEVQAMDSLLLLGTRSQLAAAAELINPPADQDTSPSQAAPA